MESMESIHSIWKPSGSAKYRMESVETNLDPWLSDGPANFSTKTLSKIWDSVFNLDMADALAPVPLLDLQDSWFSIPLVSML